MRMLRAQKESYLPTPPRESFPAAVKACSLQRSVCQLKNAPCTAASARRDRLVVSVTFHNKPVGAECPREKPNNPLGRLGKVPRARRHPSLRGSLLPNSCGASGGSGGCHGPARGELFEVGRQRCSPAGPGLRGGGAAGAFLSWISFSARGADLRKPRGYFSRALWIPPRARFTPPLAAFTARPPGTQRMPSGVWRAQPPRPLAAHGRAGPSHALWVCELQLALGLANDHLRSNSMTPSLTEKKKKKTTDPRKQTTLLGNKSPERTRRTGTATTSSSPPLFFTIARNRRSRPSLAFYR